MIVFDIETTGLDEVKCQIVSLGAVDFVSPSRVFYGECKIQRGTLVTKEALAVTGFTLDDLTRKDKPTLKFLLARFFRWADKCYEKTLAGENPWFDAGFLRRAAEKNGFRWPFGHRLVDLHSISYSRFLQLGKQVPTREDLSALNLDETLRFVGLRVIRERHNALEDAKLEAEALSRISLGKSLFEEFSRYELPPHLTKVIRLDPTQSQDFGITQLAQDAQPV